MLKQDASLLMSPDATPIDWVILSLQYCAFVILFCHRTSNLHVRSIVNIISYHESRLFSTNTLGLHQIRRKCYLQVGIDYETLDITGQVHDLEATSHLIPTKLFYIDNDLKYIEGMRIAFCYCDLLSNCTQAFFVCNTVYRAIRSIFFFTLKLCTKITIC